MGKKILCAVGIVLIGILTIICGVYGLLASSFVCFGAVAIFCVIFLFLSARLNASPKENEDDEGGRLWPEVLGIFSNIFKLLSKKNYDKEFVLDLWRLAKNHGVCPEDMECDEDLKKLGLAKEVEVLNNKIVFYRGDEIEETWESYP